MKDYELTVLFHPDLEMNIDPALDKVKKTVEANGGKIIKSESEGKKHLAYQISGNDFAVFYYFDVSLPAGAPAKISSVFNITDEILRYLLVRTDERRAKQIKAEEDNSTKSTEEKGE